LASTYQTSISCVLGGKLMKLLPTGWDVPSYTTKGHSLHLSWYRNSLCDDGCTRIALVQKAIYIKPPNSFSNYLHPVVIVAVQSALNETSNVVTQLQLGEVGNLMQHSYYQSNTMALPVPTTVDIQKLQIYDMKTCNPKNATLFKHWISSGNIFQNISSVGGLKLMAAQMWGEDGIHPVVGTHW